jgi:hypothetical protein
MSNTATFNGMGKRPYDAFLANYITKPPRPPAAGNHPVTHCGNYPRVEKSEMQSDGAGKFFPTPRRIIDSFFQKI